MIFLASIANGFLAAYLTTIAWAWHVVPVFGLPQITTLQALALILLLNWRALKPADLAWAEEHKPTMKRTVFYTVAHLFCFALLWLVHVVQSHLG